MKTPAPTHTNLFERETYQGENWAASTQRPGCQDFLECASRVGDQTREYKTPILNSSTRTK